MPRNSPFLACILALALLSGAAAPTARAQDLVANLATPTEAKGPTAIPVGDIPSRADIDERFADEVILQSKYAGTGDGLSRQLQAIGTSVNEKIKLSSFNQLNNLPILRIESLDRHWSFDAHQFEEWRSNLKLASDPYTSYATEIAEHRADWEATRQAADAGSMPTALTDRITQVLARLDLAEKALSAPLARYIELGRRSNTIEAQIKSGQKAVASAIKHIDGRLTHIEAPPIWKLGGQQAVDDSSVQSMKTGLGIELSFMREYSTSDGGNQRLLDIWQLLLLPLLVWLSLHYRRSGKPHDPAVGAAEEDPTIVASRRVLRRPVSSWLLLSMLGVLVFEPDAPLMLHQLIMLLALVPALRLLPPRIFQLLGPWPYLASGLYLLLRLSFLFLANSLLYRSYYLFVTLLALVATLWLLQRGRSHHSARSLQGKSRAAIRSVAWSSVVLMAVSAIANIVGNFSLSEMLTGGLLDSGYMALIMYSGVTVFIALLHLFFALKQLNRLRIVREHSRSILHGMERLLGFAAVAGWLVFTLDRFRLFRPLYDAVTAILGHAFQIGEISLTLGSVLLFIVSVLIAFWAARTIRFVLKEEVLPKMSLPRGVDNSVASLTYYALILLGIVFALAAAGFKVSQLAFMFGALGVGIGLGLQSVVNNFVSGLILMFERPIQPGDTVDIGTTSGTVREIGMRATTIKTFEGADVVVPNGTLLSENLTNWTLRDMNRRVEVKVGVGYHSNPAEVAELLMQVVKQCPDLISTPAPMVLFTGMSASSLDFSVRAWTRDFDQWILIQSDLAIRVHAALVEAGIEIPYPQRDLHLRSVSESVGDLLAARSKTSEGEGDSTRGHGDAPVTG